MLSHLGMCCAAGDGVEGGMNSRYKLSIDGLVLTIHDVCKNCSDGSSDLMSVQCNVSNIYGYAFATGYVNVLGNYSIS